MNEELYMLILGCRPTGRYTEQHDIFFGIGSNLVDLIPGIKKSWPEAKGNLHIDAWRKVTNVDGFEISVIPNNSKQPISKQEHSLYFINLGGYKENELDEFHYKLLVVAENLEQAKNKARKSAFFRASSVTGSSDYHNAVAHIDDKYGVDIDDAYKIEDILPVSYKERYSLQIKAQTNIVEADTIHAGYYPLNEIAKLEQSL
ncbi:MAG: DUF1543 domain-containing protein [Chitinophagaceae bacterium]